MQMAKPISTRDLMGMYSEFYKDEPFVRIMDDGEMPQTQSVRGSNFCDIMVESEGLRVVAVSVIDNLVKGASGQAIQNMNLMCGFKEQDGLIGAGLLP